MEIAPGVHAIQVRRVRIHAICAERIWLIDAGLPGSRPAVERYLAGIGRSLDELAAIVCTHGHPDHIGGVRELAGDGVDVYLHAADYANVQMSLGQAIRRPSRGRFFASVTRPPARALPLEDGQVLPILGGLRVVHTPGHTPGSVCLYAARDRLLFTGDVLEARRGRLSFASPVFSDDMAMARASVRRLAQLDVETIVFSHFPPWRHEANGALRELVAKA
jgi:glyoxylase-like metal-dependent hydrolase (beta-lactamase superfamily II)